MTVVTLQMGLLSLSHRGLLTVDRGVDRGWPLRVLTVFEVRFGGGVQCACNSSQVVDAQSCYRLVAMESRVSITERLRKRRNLLLGSICISADAFLRGHDFVEEPVGSLGALGRSRHQHEVGDEEADKLLHRSEINLH